MIPRLLPITTPRCLLRGFHERDLEAFAVYRADPEVARYQSWSSYSMEDARGFYEAQSHTELGVIGTWYQVAVAEIGTDALLGDCALHFLDAEQVEIGFTLAPASQGRGLMREAAAALVGGVFERLGKHRIIAVTDARNAPAAKLLRDLGFRREAHFRQNIFFKGEWGDEFVFACLAEDWRVGRASP